MVGGGCFFPHKYPRLAWSVEPRWGRLFTSLRHVAQLLIFGGFLLQGCTKGAVSVQTTKHTDEPNCSDGIKNNDESDIDCGGNCSTSCDPGKQCGDELDCETGICRDGSCGVPTCNDGEL